MSTFTGTADLIRRWRQEAGLTQRELAVRVGTTQSVISRLEREGYEGHSLSMLVRIGTALNRRFAIVDAVAPGSAVREQEPAYPDTPGAARESALMPAQVQARAVQRLSGTIRVGPGNVADDVRRARARRGGEEKTTS